MTERRSYCKNTDEEVERYLRTLDYQDAKRQSGDLAKITWFIILILFLLGIVVIG